MIRRIIHINQDICSGCGLCVSACHEGALGLRDNKAVLLREDYCDGLGNCLPTCPTGAITFVEREALEYDEDAVLRNIEENQEGLNFSSQLLQWPVQIKLVPVAAPYFENAQLLIAADCSAYAYANFHEKFMRNKITLMGCPKLDKEDYSIKLSEIIKQNKLKSITAVRMEVPCCGGIEQAVKTALSNSGKMLPWQVVTLSTAGRILED